MMQRNSIWLYMHSKNRLMHVTIEINNRALNECSIIDFYSDMHQSVFAVCVMWLLRNLQRVKMPLNN